MHSFSGFSQQEQPKRVTVVVTAKEITPQKVVQLPADNVPVTVNSKPTTAVKKNLPIYTAAKNKAKSYTKVSTKKLAETSPKVASVPASKSKAAAKENTEVVTTLKPNRPTKPALVTPPTVKREIAVAKPAPAPTKEIKKTEKAVATPPPMTTANYPQKDNKTTDLEKTDHNDASMKADYGRAAPQLSPDGQTNTISYIWIGVFLIIAGVVLGLLFGKPAFLISFVGVVFVALGMII